MNTVDARGFSCPEPLIMTKAAIEKGLPLVVMVDSMTPVNNITRFATNAGYKSDCKTVGEDYELTISK